MVFSYPTILAAGVPEVPNAVKLLTKHLLVEHPWTEFLSVWESSLYTFLVAAILSTVFYVTSHQRNKIPEGLQNFLEYVAETLDKMLTGIMGQDGKRFIPFLGSLFIYILSMNLFGVIPLMKSPTSSLSVTLALGLCVFGFVQYLSIKNMGLKGYLFHLMGSPKTLAGWLIMPLMLPIELITQISRPITLSLRLAGNILGEKILVGFFAVFGATWLMLFPIQTPVILFGILTSLMQACVFTLLSAVYISLSLKH
ncbi:MAG: F0F1 ATP synthase subunit A [Verrucomicrobia bacterium]|nr:F0F1 ATP synthase subunit A [Verrucomicrobiota bacterium]MBS0636112.1 F0F1 ATP synthase subunit A [Verrucomicrobiota bacterium]